MPRYWQNTLKLWPYLISAILTYLIFEWFYGGVFSINFHYPFTDPGDLWLNLAQIKSLVEGEWFPFFGMIMNRIGAPFGPVNFSIDFPLLEQLQYCLLKIIGLFTGNVFLIVNIYYFLTFIFTAWATIYACGKFRVEKKITIVISLLFTFLPFHFFRYGHIMLAAYYLIPLAGVVILRLWSHKPLFLINSNAKSIWLRFDKKSWFASYFNTVLGLTKLHSRKREATRTGRD